MSGTSHTCVKAIKTNCGICNEMAETRLLTIRCPGLHPETISIFECKNCNTRETSVFEYREDRRGNIRITCFIKDAQDLQRYVYLSQDAKVSFYDKESNLIYEFRSFTSETVVIEMLLTNVISKIADFYGIKLDEADGDSALCGSDGVCSGISVHEKKLAMEKIKMIKKEIQSPDLKMVILDSSGTSRVGPPNQKFPPDFKKEDINLYNDEKVIHTFEE